MSKVTEAMQGFALGQALKYLEKDPEKLRAMVKMTGAVSTDYESPEEVDTLCDRTTPYANNWEPQAEKLWR